jgi:hypothetical protein
VKDRFVRLGDHGPESVHPAHVVDSVHRRRLSSSAAAACNPRLRGGVDAMALKSARLRWKLYGWRLGRTINGRWI